MYQVNELCGDLDNLVVDRHDLAEEHEREHEASANKCLAGSTAQHLLAEMEQITGENNGIVLTYNGMFHGFYYSQAFADAQETNTATPTSPMIWEWRDHNQWTEQALEPVRHTGTDGC